MGPVPPAEPGEGQIRIKVKAAGISPTDLALAPGTSRPSRCPRTPCSASRQPAPSTRPGPASPAPPPATASRPCCSAWAGTPSTRWPRSGPTSQTPFRGRCRRPAQLGRGGRPCPPAAGRHKRETLLLFGGGGSVGIIATQLAVAQGFTVISAVGEHDETLARELGATPVRYGPGVAGRVRALGAVDAVFDAAGKGVLADAIALAGGPNRVITLSDPAAADFGVTLSEPSPTVPPAPWTKRSPCSPTASCGCARTNHAHAAGRRGPPPAGKRRRARAHHPHPVKGAPRRHTCTQCHHRHRRFP